MEARGANPNVVRNIIYRDKGKVADKRVLFAILGELWESTGRPPLRAPELEPLLAGSPEGEGDVVGLLGREKKRAYGSFVGAVRAGQHPKLLLTGRPGSGKTLLTDLVQRALELPPKPAGRVLRQEFSAPNLAAALQGLALSVGVPAEVVEAKLVKVGVASAYSVQADAQADVARVVLERLRAHSENSHAEPLVLLLHVSQSSGTPQQDTLGDVPLRLSTPDVPRVGLTEWLWHTLLEPLGRLSRVSLLVSMADLPVTLADRTGAFEGPLKLSPPSANEARRFIRARAGGLSSEQQEGLVGRAKRSYEDLRTLTLLAEAREPVGGGKHTEQLAQLVERGDARLRDFLEVLAVLSLPEFPVVQQDAVEALREADPPALNPLELAFLDAVPGEPRLWRPFSRLFARALRGQLKEGAPERFRSLNVAASRLYAEGAREAPRSDAGGRFVHHLFAARAWAELIAWADGAPVPQSLLQRLWRAAQHELRADPATLEAVALRVAGYYVRLGSTDYPDAALALAVLAASDDDGVRAWTLLRRAEGAVLQGRFEHAEALLRDWREVNDPVLSVEAALVRANLARWHSRLSDAAALTQESIDTLAKASDGHPHALDLRIALWAGMVAKDDGDLEEALRRFRAIRTDDDLLRARVYFQEGDVLLTLGRFAEGYTALSEALASAYSGEAPAFERARYRSRRGTLLRRRGDFGAADADFAAAKTVLTQAELGTASFRLHFEGAKIQNEEALNMLAAGRAGDAVASLQRDLEVFSGYGGRYGVDPSFRMLRGRLRLAVAYACRAFGWPYRLPLGPYPETAARHPDLIQARRLVQGVLGTLASTPERYGGLKTPAHLTASLLLPPAEAVSAAQAALASARYPYQQGRAQVHLAAALLRSGDYGRAHESIAPAREQLRAAQTDDHALYAYLAGLEAGALLYLGDADGAHARILGALGQPQLGPYHDLLLRAFGEAAERLGQPLDSATLGLGGPLPETLRPADALVLRWEQRAAFLQVPETSS